MKFNQRQHERVDESSISSTRKGCDPDSQDICGPSVQKNQNRTKQQRKTEKTIKQKKSLKSEKSREKKLLEYNIDREIDNELLIDLCDETDSKTK